MSTPPPTPPPATALPTALGNKNIVGTPPKWLPHPSRFSTDGHHERMHKSSVVKICNRRIAIKETTQSCEESRSSGIAVLTALAGWRIGACELANMNFQDDLHDLASQVGTHIGFGAPSSDEETALSVIRKARERGIDLQPTQVTVRRTSVRRDFNSISGSGLYSPRESRVLFLQPAFRSFERQKGNVEARSSIQLNALGL